MGERSGLLSQLKKVSEAGVEAGVEDEMDTVKAVLGVMVVEVMIVHLVEDMIEMIMVMEVDLMRGDLQGWLDSLKLNYHQLKLKKG